MYGMAAAMPCHVMPSLPNYNFVFFFFLFFSCPAGGLCLDFGLFTAAKEKSFSDLGWSFVIVGGSTDDVSRLPSQ